MLHSTCVAWFAKFIFAHIKFWIFFFFFHILRLTASAMRLVILVVFVLAVIATEAGKVKPPPNYPDGYTPGIDNCTDPNQEWRTDQASANCARPLCITYQLPNGRRCPNLAVVLYGITPGCVCKPGFAQISPEKCVDEESCDCLEIADAQNYNLYEPISTT